MSQIQSYSNQQSEPARVSIDPRLLDLLRHLRTLPPSLSDHPSIYPFPRLTLDSHDIQHYGSPQAALDHHLDLVFGSRNAGQLIQFRGRGASLEAVVYTLSKYIDGEDGENKPLWTWVQHLTNSAIDQSKADSSLVSKPSTKRSQHSKTGKRNGLQPRKKRPVAQVKAKKYASAIRYPHDPDDLEDDILELEPGSGRSRDELLDRLTAPCHSIIDPTHHRVRCKGTGCGWSWAHPRIATRVLKHAYHCGGLDDNLRAEVKHRSASLSLASKLEVPNSSINIEALPTTHLQKREDLVNHALLKWLCDRMIPPSAVDSLRWREFVSALDPNLHTASGSTIADNSVTTEAAYIHEVSIHELSLHDQLTLSYDGGTTRKHESVYTVHVTNPLTREAHIMEGNEASGISHTAEHICSVIDKVLKEVGPERFASIVSDNAGNTRAARALIEQEYPWIITLQDACHQLNNAAKDVGQLVYFQQCINQLRSIIRHFHSSSYAARHLAALRVAYHIAEGLIAIGLTRFASFYYAAYSTLKCMPLIRELISSEVLEVNSSSPIYWMMDRATVLTFQEQLAQLVSVLEPFARAIKCLESSHSTLSDVYMFWLAILARFRDVFAANETVSGVGLPVLVIEQIMGILNARHSDMFQHSSGQVYFAAFFLDIRFRSSDILLRHPAYPLTKTLDNQHIPSGADLLPDQDLRQALPAYTTAGDYLIKLLARIFNKDPNASLFDRYSNWPQIATAFRNQLILFIRGLRPFHQVPKSSTEQTYWEAMRSVPAAELLAHLGVILTSIVPNSMAEERSMSTITKLNSPDRASQKVATLINMVTIRQHYRREENRTAQNSKVFRPTVRFVDLSQTLPPINELNEGSEMDSKDVSAVLEHLDNELAPEDTEIEALPVAGGNVHHFEAELNDGVSLSSKLLLSLLSDRSSISVKRPSSPEPSAINAQPPQKRQPVDVSMVGY